MASTSNISEMYKDTMGIIQTLAQSSGGLKVNTAHWGMYRTRLESDIPWCLDNGMFTGKFEVAFWLKRIEAFYEYKNTCVFIAIPDVIGDCSATLAQFSHYRSMVKDFPVALVSQDGIKKQAHNIPWDDFDCLFIGGSDEHKLGKEGGWILNQAKKRDKWVHVGRVNSSKRILQFWRADSWDGTHLGFMPSDVTKFHAAVLQVRAMKQSKGLFDDLHSDVSHGDNSRQSI